MRPLHANSLVDLAYGILIVLALGLIVFVPGKVGLAFGVGVLLSYVVHVGWKMARFDPEWMDRHLEEERYRG